MNGRLITNNVLVTFEIMHHINQRKGGGGIGEMVLKLDMSKAYDRVEWACLDKIWSSSVTYSIRINGKPSR